MLPGGGVRWGRLPRSHFAPVATGMCEAATASGGRLVVVKKGVGEGPESASESPYDPERPVALSLEVAGQVVGIQCLSHSRLSRSWDWKNVASRGM